MHLEVQDGVVALALILAVATMLAVAPTLRIPYPILLVLGGLAIGVVPGMPEFELEPELVFFGVLPPLLYSAAFFTSLRELRATARPIGLLAVGLVLVTTVGVAVVAHTFVDGLSWASAFVLGAIVSPTDPLAATSIARRLGVPRKLVTIVEGESLVNDGTGLVLYRVAVAAVVTGSFSAIYTGGLFVVSAGGGIAVGLGVGWLVRQVRRRLDNPPAEITISLLTGYVAFIPAELMGVSAVLAAVTAGIYLGWHTPELTSAQVRLQGVAVWEIVQYLLNALLFVLIGLQLPVVIDALGDVSEARLLGYAALVSATVIALRFAWVFAVLHAPKRIARRMSNWRGAVFLSWAGMRGAVSLAAALALPLQTDAGTPFPGRDLILFLTFSVILATLVGQGLTLPYVIRTLGLEEDGIEDREDAKARIHAAEAALARLEELVREEWVREDTAERVRGAYRFRTSRFQARLDDGDDGAIESRSQDYQRLRRELLDAERQALIDLRRSGAISNDVWLRVGRDLDLEDQRLDI
ncbi:MAG TPA: Na+/H+ antiporter [Gaiellaceae bacterium]|nr:Na+/H+ antiporter [Gaiellaceae bacterium]